MRRLLSNVPIKRKLTIITMLVTGSALLPATGAFLTFEQAARRGGLQEEVATTAQILGDNSSAALSFNDPVSAGQTLKSLRVDPDVIGAAIYDVNGKLFATYRNGASAMGLSFSPPAVPTEGAHFESDDWLGVFSPIDLAGEKVGTVYLRLDLLELREQLWQYGSIALLLMLGASVVAYMISRRLVVTISGPISHLAGVVDTVATKKDYSIRAVKQSEDELGRLMDGFNEMLGQIQLRDGALELARGSLEQRVDERTRELQAEIAERREAEIALRDSEERFSSAFENASIGMALVAIEGQWLKVNRALCQLVGYSSEELLARTFQEITHPDDLGADLAYVRRVLTEEIASYQMEKRYLHKRGHAVFVLLSVSLVRDAAGRPLHFIAQIQDISERKRAEAELAQTHKQLLEASRLGGMAEVATNVLHNVGNVLNSVNVSAHLVTESAKRSRVGNLAKAAALLREHVGDLGAFMTIDPRGLELPNYLTRLAEHLMADQAVTVKELELLSGNVDHIKEIVALQQSHAKMSGVTEILSVTDLVEESLRMNIGALTRHGILITREFAEVPAINIEKHKVLQILVNLLTNAKHACSESGRTDKQLTVRVANGGSGIRISVSDNGVGIVPENLTRIFNHGFTTRKAGHGFGLHSGALAAREMGGSLSVHSQGLGKGATFTLELPIPATAQAA